MGRLGDLFRWCAVVAILIAALAARASPAVDPSIEELKARVASASMSEKPRLCLQIAQRQLTEADKLYTASESEKGQAALADAIAFSEQARDYAIQAHKHEKQTEIAVRGMIRKLVDMQHTLSQEEQAPLKDAIGHLQRVRDDLLMAMFPKAAK